MGGDRPTVGVLALQGDFAAHEEALRLCALSVREVRDQDDLLGLDGLVLPGGESSTMLNLLQSEGLEQPLGQVLRSGLPVLATCAGLILLAKEVTSPMQRSYGLLDVTVARNGYGRQIASGTFALESRQWQGLEGVFIRAPRITRVGATVSVLATRSGDACLVREGPLLGACFHPELQSSHPVTAYFAHSVRTFASSRPHPLPA